MAQKKIAVAKKKHHEASWKYSVLYQVDSVSHDNPMIIGSEVSHHSQDQSDEKSPGAVGNREIGALAALPVGLDYNSPGLGGDPKALSIGTVQLEFNGLCHGDVPPKKISQRRRLGFLRTFCVLKFFFQNLILLGGLEYDIYLSIQLGME